MKLVLLQFISSVNKIPWLVLVDIFGARCNCNNDIWIKCAHARSQGVRWAHMEPPLPVSRNQEALAKHNQKTICDFQARNAFGGEGRSRESNPLWKSGYGPGRPTLLCSAFCNGSCS